MSRLHPRAAIALALVLYSCVAEATTARRLSDEELTSSASVIAIGRCTSVRSVWEGRTLVTVATIVVEEALKGSPGTVVTVALPGGIDANRRFPVSVVWPGAPTLQVGEDVLLFLEPEEGISSGAVVAGFSQGKFSIGRDAAGRRYVSRDLTRLTLQDERGVSRGNRVQKPLDQFRAEILGFLRQGV
jgi:hypothetical protein